MKIKGLNLILIILIMFGTISIISKSAEEGKKITTKGEILDLACYISHEGKGIKHQKCALTCLKNGQPMGLLTEDGTVYLLFADHQDSKAFDEAKNYAAEQVEITGVFSERAGIKAITVQSVKKIK